MALQHEGLHVNSNLEVRSRTVDRFFKCNAGNVKQDNIISLLRKMISGDGSEVGEVDPDDVAKIYILLVFNCVLFPTAHQYVPSFLLHYVDDLGSIGEHAWGYAAHRFVEDALIKCAQGRRYADDCMYGMMAWFFERVPYIGKPIAKLSVPRFARWQAVHQNVEECMAALKKLTPDDVVNFHPLKDEDRFLLPVREVHPICCGSYLWKN